MAHQLCILMSEVQVTWIVIGFAVLGIGAAIIHIFQIPRGERFRFERRKSIHEQLDSLPSDVGAVLIKGDKKRWLIIWSPVIIITAVLTAFTTLLSVIEAPECEELFGINVSYLSIVQFTYAFPILVFLVTAYFGYIGIKSLKSGYYPPRDFVQFSDTVAKKGKVSKLQGIAALLAPLFGVFIILQGHNSYMQLTKGKDVAEISERLERDCQ